MRGSQTKDQARQGSQAISWKFRVDCVFAITSLYGDMSFLSCSLAPGRDICVVNPGWRLGPGSRRDTTCCVMSEELYLVLQSWKASSLVNPNPNPIF
jgi:hypothetical protein